MSIFFKFLKGREFLKISSDTAILISYVSQGNILSLNYISSLPYASFTEEKNVDVCTLKVKYDYKNDSSANLG